MQAILDLSHFQEQIDVLRTISENLRNRVTNLDERMCVTIDLLQKFTDNLIKCEKSINEQNKQINDLHEIISILKADMYSLKNITFELTNENLINKHNIEKLDMFVSTKVKNNE